MPGPLIRRPAEFDPAAVASHLPEKLQWPVGAALEALKSFLPAADDPVGALAPNPIGMASEKSVIGRGLQGPHPAIRALMDALSSAPVAVDADKLALSEKLGGWVPHRSMVAPPEGFTFPEQMPGPARFIARDPALSDRYVQEQWRTVGNNADQSRNGFRPSKSKVAPKSKSKDLLEGFESKFNVRDAMK